MLELSHVTFRYAEGLPDVLKDISLSFDKGEFVAITGRNGCGKTTVTRLLTGLEKAASGQILYHGKDVTREEPSERSRFIGYVFQQPDRQMFMPTVREEIAFGPYQQEKRGAELEEAVARAMQDTDTEALAEEYPRILSRGDQQRVAIASALAMDTEYLVLDEPTSGLDPVSRDDICNLFKSLVKSGERAIFFSTHIISDIEKCATHVTYIHDGEIAESTSVDNMLDKYSYIKEDGKPTLEDIIVSLERTDYDDKIFD